MSNSNAPDNVGDDDDIEIPRLKTITKPKNLRKRKREVDEVEEAIDPNKKPKTTESANSLSEVRNVEETRLMQQLRSVRHRGSDMSSEDVRLSKAATGVEEDQSIGSLTQNFTGQRVQVNTLDKRMEEYIEQEMARRKAARSDSSQSEEPTVVESITKEDVEQEEREEKEKNLSTKQNSTGEKPALPLPSTTVIDLSDTILRATSSSSVQSTAEPTKKWHKHEGAAPTTGILEVELPVEEQLRMFEATREAALKALKEQRKRKPHPNRDLASGFGDLGEATTAAGNVSSDFSKHKRYQATAGSRATDELVYDKYKKKQSNMFR